MTTALKIAGFGLAAGTAVMLALATPATARGPADMFGGSAFGDGFAAGPRGGIFTVRFADLDADGDGFVTEAELTARADAFAADRLAEVDTDGDGTVTAAELEARIVAGIADRAGHPMARSGRGDPATMAKTMVERLLAARDADGDGALSRAELSPAADVAALIDRFDTDDDNAWSAEEFAQVAEPRGGLRERGHWVSGFGDGKRR